MKRSMIMLEEEEEKCLKKGPWSVEEDIILMSYINIHGDGRWNSLAKFSGLKRSGKSCRLRWVNYLRPDLKRGNITPEEERLIIELQRRWGNRWSKIARHMPGRTDNEIKNYWRTRIRRKLLASGRASATNSTSSTSSSLITGNNSYQPDANAEAELTASPFTSITNIWPPISQSQINEGHYAVSNPTMQQGCVLLPGEASANEELLGYQKQQRQQKEQRQQEGGMETETETGEWGDGLNSTSTDDVRNSFSDKITSTMSVWAWPPYDQSVSMMEMMEMEIDNCFEFPLMSV